MCIILWKIFGRLDVFAALLQSSAGILEQPIGASEPSMDSVVLLAHGYRLDGRYDISVPIPHILF